MNGFNIPRVLISLMVLLPMTSMSIGCADSDEPTVVTQEQAIFYGSRSPRVVSLTAGEQMAIGFLSDPYGNPFCSGTLIDRDVVVTAEHCTVGSSPSTIRFGVGTPESPDALFQVQRIAEHSSRDVALLFLSEDAVARVPAIEPVPFLRQALPQSYVGQRVEASGYGQTHDNSTGRYFASLTLIEIDDVNYTVDGQGQQGICFGDSGGPLLVSIGGHTVVAGVESNGDSTCVDVDHLTRLDRVQDWIDQQNGSFDPNSDGPYEPSVGGKPPVGGEQPNSAPNTGDKPPVSSGPSTDSAPTGTPGGTGGDQTPDDGGDFGGISLPGCSAAGSGNIDVAWLGFIPMFLGMALRRRRAC